MTVLKLSVVVGVALLLAVSCSTSPNPDKTVRAFAEALNSHSVDSLMPYYSDSAIFDVPKMGMHLVGVAALRGVAEYDSVLQTNLVLSEVVVVGDTVFCAITEDNNWMRAAGMTTAHYPEAHVVVKGGQITHLLAHLSDSSANRFANVITEFTPWVMANHPTALPEMAPGGKFQFNGINGARMVALLSEWRAASSQSAE